MFAVTQKGGVELAALDTLQHGLTRDAEMTHGIAHTQVAIGWLVDEEAFQIVGQANLPGGSGRDLFAGDEAVIEPSMEGGRRHAEDSSGLADVDDVAFWRLFGRYEAWDFPIAAERTNGRDGEAQTCSGFSPLPIEDAGNDGIGIVDSEPADEVDRVLVGAHRRWPGARQADLELGEHAAFPAKGEIGPILVTIDGDDDFLEQTAEQ